MRLSIIHDDGRTEQRDGLLPHAARAIRDTIAVREPGAIVRLFDLPDTHHSQDSDCEWSISDNTCTVCGADHSGKCVICGGRAYHKIGCRDSQVSHEFTTRIVQLIGSCYEPCDANQRGAIYAVYRRLLLNGTWQHMADCPTQQAADELVFALRH